MSQKVIQSQISPGTFLLDDNEKIWIIGSFIGVDGCADNYEAAEYKGEPPIDYPAVIKIKPHGDASFTSEINFYEQHANPAEITKWITYQNLEYDDLGIPRYLGSAKNIKIANTNIDFLVLEQYGSDLETILVTHENLFPKPTVLKLAYHIVRVLEYFHNRGFVHGDVQASNLRLGRHDKSRVYLLQQVQTMDESNRNSTIFWSVDRHSGENTKRGDFESLLYNLIDWSGGLLPWKHAPPDEVKGMKIKALEDPEQFLQDAFPNCQCKNPSDCIAARKCDATGEPVAPYKCLQAIVEFMGQVVDMKKKEKPNYVDIEEALRKRLLNMYQVPTSEMEFSVRTVIGDEDHEEKLGRGRAKGANSYVRGLGITAGRLAIIIAENCLSFDEVDVFDIKPGGVVDVIFKMKRTNRECAVKSDNIRKAWEKNTYGLRTMVIEQWRLKGLKPEDYEIWKKEKDQKNKQAALDRNEAKKIAITKAKKKTTLITGEKLLAKLSHTDESIVPHNLNEMTNDSRSLRSKTQQNQQIGPIDKPMQRVPSRHRDRSSSSSSTLSEVRRTLQDTRSSSLCESNGFQTPVFSASSSGFGSRRSSSRGGFHSDDSSPLKNDRFLEKVPHQSRKVVAETKETAENKPVTRCRSVVPADWQEWPDTYEWLTVWLKMKDKDLKTFDSIPSEPQMILDQAQQVRVLLDEFDKSEDRLNHLVEALENLPTDSSDAEKLRQIKQRWRDGLALLEERGKQLGDTSLGQLRHVLQGISDRLTQQPINKEQLEKEELLRELECLSGQLKSQQAQLVSTETVVRQLAEVFIDNNLQEEFERLNKFHDELQQKIQVEKAEVEKSIRDGRQFDDLRQEILVWLVKENEGISEKPLVSTDRATLLKQYEHYKSIFQRIIDREVEVLALLAKGGILLKPQYLENASIQQRTLDAVRSQWNLLKKQSIEIDNKLQSCLEHCNRYYDARGVFLEWLSEAERKPIMLNDSQKQLEELTAFNSEIREKSDEFEQIIKLGDTFISACDNDKNDTMKNELIATKDRWNKLNSDVRERMQSLKDLDKHLVVFKDKLQKLALRVEELDSHDALAGKSKNSKLSDLIKELQEKWLFLQQSLDIIRQQANDLVPKAREQGIDAEHLLEDVDRVAVRITNLEAKLVNSCKEIVEQGFTNFERQPGEFKQEKFDVKIELEQDDESRDNRPPVEVIDLSSGDESLDTIVRQLDEIVQTDNEGLKEVFFYNNQNSNAIELQQKAKDKSPKEKEDNISDNDEDTENNKIKKAKTSRKKRKKFSSATSSLKDSGSDYNGKKKKGKASGKRKKGSDSEWSPARASGSKECDSDWSPSSVSGRKRPRRKTRPLPTQDDDSDLNGSDLNGVLYF